jgi:hypothetical protein
MNLRRESDYTRELSRSPGRFDDVPHAIAAGYRPIGRDAPVAFSFWEGHPGERGERRAVWAVTDGAARGANVPAHHSVENLGFVHMARTESRHHMANGSDIAWRRAGFFVRCATCEGLEQSQAT